MLALGFYLQWGSVIPIFHRCSVVFRVPVFRRCSVVPLSGGIRVRIPQELDVVAFWSWNLDIVVFQPWNLDVVAFCPLKICYGITMS